MSEEDKGLREFIHDGDSDTEIAELSGRRCKWDADITLVSELI